MIEYLLRQEYFIRYIMEVKIDQTYLVQTKEKVNVVKMSKSLLRIEKKVSYSIDQKSTFKFRRGMRTASIVLRTERYIIKIVCLLFSIMMH